MATHVWVPVDADTDSWEVQICYVNELGEEYVHSVVAAFQSRRGLCWAQCSGDWPACKSSCPLYTERLLGVEYE